jgi:hypothetical protein
MSEIMLWRMGKTTELRRIIAMVLTVAVFISGSLVNGLPSPAETSLGSPIMGEFATYDKAAPKPCRKTSFPGALKTCPLSNLNFVAITASKPEHSLPSYLTVASWGLQNTTVSAQCGGFSPYRPPCLTI